MRRLIHTQNQKVPSCRSLQSFQNLILMLLPITCFSFILYFTNNHPLTLCSVYRLFLSVHHLLEQFDAVKFEFSTSNNATAASIALFSVGCEARHHFFMDLKYYPTALPQPQVYLNTYICSTKTKVVKRAMNLSRWCGLYT